MISRDLMHSLFELPWIVFLLYWLVSALKIRPAERKESLASRYGVALILIAGFVLLFSERGNIGVLGLRFVPGDRVIAVAGVVLTWLGIGLAIWARFHLGQNWSARVTIKEGHELIRTGPYAHLRHPIYSGLLLAVIGSALGAGKWRCVPGVLLVVIGFSLKAMKEETMLRQHFGPAFEEHRQHTGFLLPRFR